MSSAAKHAIVEVVEQELLRSVEKYDVRLARHYLRNVLAPNQEFRIDDAAADAAKDEKVFHEFQIAKPLDGMEWNTSVGLLKHISKLHQDAAQAGSSKVSCDWSRVPRNVRRQHFGLGQWFRDTDMG